MLVMRVGPSITAAILATVVDAVPRAESGDIGAVDGSLNLFTAEASEALVDDLQVDISGMNGYLDPNTDQINLDSPTNPDPLMRQANLDETNIFDNLDLAFDDTAISSNFDSSCLSLVSKRDGPDEVSLLGKSLEERILRH